MRERLQSSTTHPINFLMVSSSDHITGATGITTTVTISKDGGAFASPAGAVTEIGSGWYSLAGNATDRNTLGSFLLHATGAGCDPTDRDYTITAYDPFNGANLALTAVPSAAPAASGGMLTVGTGSGQITPTSGDVTIAPNTLDVGQFTATAWELLTQRRLSSAGTTSPVTLDKYKIGGFDVNGNLYYTSTTLGTPIFIWLNPAGPNWVMSTVLLTAGAASFATASNANVLGPYTLQGSATGTPILTFQGGVMLDALQFGLSPATNAQAVAILADLVTLLAVNPATSTQATTIIADLVALAVQLGTPAGASVSADVAAVKADTVAIKAKTDAMLIIGVGIVQSGPAPTLRSFTLSQSPNMTATTGYYNGRRLYGQSGVSGTQDFDPCVTHVVVGSGTSATHAFTFAADQKVLPVTGDQIAIIGV